MKIILFFELIAFYLLLIHYIKKDTTKSIIILGTTILYFVISTFSLYYIEGGTYISELNMTSYYTPFSLLIYISYLVLFIIVLYKKKLPAGDMLQAKKSKLTQILYILIFTFAILSLVYLYVDLFYTGAPLITGNANTKMNYYHNLSKFPFTNTFYTLITYYFPLLLGVSYLNDKSKVKQQTKIIYMLLVIVYLLLIGFKVSGLKTAIINFIVPILLTKMVNKQIKPNFKFLKKILFLLIPVAIFSIVMNYSVYSAGGSVTEQFKNRTFALTSHFWWVTDNYRRNNPISTEEITSNIKTNALIVANNESVFSKNNGIVKLMYFFAPKHTSDFYVSHHTRMATNFITVSVYDYGYMVTILVVIISALFYSYLIKSLYEGILKQDIIQLILTYKLMIYFDVYLWASGTLNEFLNYENIVILVLLILYRVYKKGIRK